MSDKNAATVRREPKSLQRIQKIADSWEETGALLSDGFHSAIDVVQRDEEEFVGRFAEGLDGVERARELYRLAHSFIRAQACAGK